MAGTDTATQGGAGGLAPIAVAGVRFVERRAGVDRRQLTFRTFLRGALTPRRRAGRRDREYALVSDWHEPHLLALALGILLLSVADALLTLTLLLHGAYEANPFLAWMLTTHPQWFAVTKMGLTGFGVVVLVVLARARLFQVIRVSHVLHWCLLAYVGVIAWELWLLRIIV
jgi:hypothetical protein